MIGQYEQSSDLSLLKDISNSLDQGFIFIGEDHRILSYNSSAAAMMKMAVNKTLREDRSILSFCQRGFRNRLASVLANVAGVSPQRWVRVFARPVPLVYEFSFQPFRSSGGSGGVLMKLTDLSQHYHTREQLDKSHERYTLATRASYDMIWERDFVNDRYYFSEALRENFGYDPRQDWSWHDVMNILICPEDREMVIAFVADCYAKKMELFQCPIHRYVRQDGSRVWVDVRCIALYDGQGVNTRTIGVTRDISRQQSLLQTLEQQTALLRASNDELQHFAYIVSHDLQEPLRMISSFMELLRKKYTGILDDRALQYIGFSIDGAERMKDRLLALLELSRVGAVGVKNKIDMDQLLTTVLQDLSVTIGEKSAAIHIPERLPEIHADPQQMHQVMLNLVGNALKYTGDRQPRIEISFKDKKDHWEFAVRDNGIGIEEKYFTKIFKLFQRLHTQDQYSGTGIGLAIVKKIIDRHRGKLWLESRPGEGTCFFFTITKSE